MYKYTQDEIETMIRDEYNRVHDFACGLWPAYANRPKPPLHFFTKGSTAGWARYTHWRVEINTHLARQNWEMAKDTISHEVAHMVNFAAFAKTGHCRNWKSIHSVLGGSSRRTYNAAVENVKIDAMRKTFVHEYKLADGKILWINTPTHNKIKSGEARRCTVTKQRVDYSHYTGTKRQK